MIGVYIGLVIAFIGVLLTLLFLARIVVLVIRRLVKKEKLLGLGKLTDLAYISLIGVAVFLLGLLTIALSPTHLLMSL